MSIFTRLVLVIGLLCCNLLASAQSNEWTWIAGDSIGQYGIYDERGIPSAYARPTRRYGAVGWTDANGNFWLFGGSGLLSQNSNGLLNDLWMYNPVSHRWTWVHGDAVPNSNGVYGTRGVPSPSNKPGGRQFAVTWADRQGNLWLFGGLGYAKEGGVTAYLNDLWKYNIATNQWTWVSGQSSANESAMGNYGVKGVEASTNYPGGRQQMAGWVDNNGSLWMFGGYGLSSPSTFSTGPFTGRLNDLWRFNPTTSRWTWISGDSVSASLVGVYGTKGIPSPSNKPGGRQEMVGWSDAAGNFWIFGGTGWGNDYNAQGDLNDLWKYNPVTGQWSWESGEEYPRHPGVYGTRGVSSPDNRPGARVGSIGWTDIPGNAIWLFGGFSSAQYIGGYYNDLWKYDLTTKEWTWMHGSRAGIPNPGIYGIRGVSAPSNTPGGRAHSATGWADAAGNLFLYGGYGLSANGMQSFRDDLWMYKTNTYSLLAANFGTEGIVTTNAGGYFNEIQAIEFDNNGRFVVAGTGGGVKAALARYKTDGTLDNTFGTGGKVIANTGTVESRAYDFAIQNDGRIISAGVAYGDGQNNDFFLCRYNSDGTPDNTFGTNGAVTTDFNSGSDEARAVTLQPDGKIVVAGWAFDGFRYNFALARYLATGALDPSFGTGGKKTVVIQTGSSSKAYAMTLQPDGKIVLGGTVINANADFALVRLNADGSLDNSFNGSGKLVKDIAGRNDGINAMILQNDGTIVVAGHEISYAPAAAGNVVVARFTASGSPDPLFDGDGIRITDLGGDNDQATGVSLQPDGRLLVSAIGANRDFNVLRYNTNGSPDITFGVNGVASKDFGNRSDVPNAIQFYQNDIYVAGKTHSSGGDLFALGRFSNHVILPAGIITFTASKVSSSKVVLNWKIADVGNSVFEIEKSTTGSSFTKIGTLAAGNAVQFEFADNNFGNQNTFYRLRILDAGSGYSYSNAVMIKAAETKTVSIFPNPATNVLQVQLPGRGMATITIHDANGRLTNSLSINASHASTTPVDISSLSKGAYLLTVLQNGKREAIQFTKQ